MTLRTWRERGGSKGGRDANRRGVKRGILAIYEIEAEHQEGKVGATSLRG